MDFKAIYEQHKNLVYNLCLSYVQNAEDAEELAQDIFISIHGRLHSFRHEAKLSTWIYRISINKCLDFIKHRQRKKRFARFTSLFYDDDVTERHDLPHFNHPGVELEQRQALEKIFELINTLPPNQKTALILARIEQKPQQEIADIMNLKLKAVESLLQRAKTGLKKKLDDTEGL